MRLRVSGWVIGALVYWLEAPKSDKQLWLPVIRLMVLVVAVEVLFALWIMGAFRVL